MDRISKGKRSLITLEFKKQIISRHESGVRICDLATQLGMAKSTVSTILKQKEAIKKANVAKGVKTLNQRTQAIEEMEKMLLIWITEKQMAGENISCSAICEKALHLHAGLIRNAPGANSDGEIFKASRGWFENFKRRSGIHVGVRAGVNQEDADRFVLEFKDYVEAEGFLPQQVFNGDETGLFWRRMPKRSYVTTEDKAVPRRKTLKNRLTLLLCANASGDFKLKPLLVYHSENPRAFKKNQVNKSKLPVVWRANSGAWVTRRFFVEWVHEVFGPSVKKYLQDNNLPLKCLLVLDNSPGHLPELEENLMEEFHFIKVKFLPPNATPLIQPMDQQVISHFKKLYTKAVLQMCFEATSGAELTLKEFWKNHFNILHCLHLIDKAWKDVSQRTLRSAWRKLWPEAVPEHAYELVEEDASIVEDIVSLGKSMGLQVRRDDVEELVEDHKTELTTEELQDFLMEQQQAEEEEETEVAETTESVSTALIQEMCEKWAEVQAFAEKYCPAGSQATNTFDGDVMSHFRQILKRREEQTSVENNSARKRSRESEPGNSGAKKFREGTARDESPSAILEGDHKTSQQQQQPCLLILEGDLSAQASVIIIAGSGSAPGWQRGPDLCCLLPSSTNAPSGLCFLLGDVKIASGQPLQVPITFEEVAVFFTEEEWALLGPGQRALHREVMEENYGMLASLTKDALFP